MSQTRFSGPIVSTGGFTGNLTGNVTGDTTGNWIIPSATVAAAGTNQATGAAISTGFTLVSAADGTKGVTLPLATAGKVCILRNLSASALKVYPNSSDKVNGGAANAELSVPANTSCMLVAYDTTDWYSVPVTPS